MKYTTIWPLRVLSYGGGVQSTCILLMSVRGVLPRLDAAIFADTGWEREQTYQTVGQVAAIAGAAGIPVLTVSAVNVREWSLRTNERNVSMPFYTSSGGQVRRQCTREAKIHPIRQKVRELMGAKKGQAIRGVRVCEQWFGISADEAHRMSKAKERWIVHHYPLCGTPIDYLPRPMSRSDCVGWLAREFPRVTVGRSSCIGCPFHGDAEWREIKRNPREWQDAVEFDEAARRRPDIRDELFVHSKRIPLTQVDLRTAEEKGQLNMFGNECSGMCGV